jgi:hypothetical protein
MIAQNIKFVNSICAKKLYFLIAAAPKICGVFCAFDKCIGIVEKV